MKQIILVLMVAMASIGCSDSVEKGPGFFNNLNNQNNANNLNNENNLNNVNNLNNCGGCTPAPICGEDPDPCSCSCEPGEVWENRGVCTDDGCFDPFNGTVAFNVNSVGQSSVWHYGYSIRDARGEHVQRSCPIVGAAPPSPDELRPNESVTFIWDGFGSTTDCDDQRRMQDGIYTVSFCYGETHGSDFRSIERVNCLTRDFELTSQDTVVQLEVDFTATELRPPIALSIENDLPIDLYLQDYDNCTSEVAWYTVMLTDGTVITRDPLWQCLCPCSMVEGDECFQACPAFACRIPTASALVQGEVRETSINGLHFPLYPVGENPNACYQVQYTPSEFVVEVCVGQSLEGTPNVGIESYARDLLCGRQTVRLDQEQIRFRASDFLAP